MVNGTVIIGPLTHVNSSTSKADSNLNFIPNYKRTRDHYFSLSVKDQNFFVNIAILFYNILYKKNSDVIMVMDQGRIVERGNHDKLISEKGIYYQLYTGGLELD